MLLYVNDNEGILFLRSVDVVVEPPTQPPAGGSAGGAFFPGASGTFQELLVRQGHSRKEKEESELILLMRIFAKVCPNS